MVVVIRNVTLRDRVRLTESQYDITPWSRRDRTRSLVRFLPRPAVWLRGVSEPQTDKLLFKDFTEPSRAGGVKASNI